MEARINKQMDLQVVAYRQLHKGQMYIEDNLKSLMQHTGMNPVLENE